MIPGGAGKLTKMTIFAFTDPERKSATSPSSMEVMYNPNKYTRNIKIDYSVPSGSGTTNSNQSFQGIRPQGLNFEFVFDGTNASPSPNGSNIGSQKSKSVQELVEEFISFTCSFNNQIHRPNYLLLTWGKGFKISTNSGNGRTDAIKCVLASATVDYSLFNSDGSPLRAKINASFSEDVEDNLRERQENRRSPDLRHIREVEEEENLDLLSFEVYNSPKYYIQLARHNKLKNFRRMKTGKALVFPPLKSE